jgi:hypothetical protein
MGKIKSSGRFSTKWLQYFQKACEKIYSSIKFRKLTFKSVGSFLKKGSAKTQHLRYRMKDKTQFYSFYSQSLVSLSVMHVMQRKVWIWSLLSISLLIYTQRKSKVYGVFATHVKHIHSLLRRESSNG